MLMLQWMWMNAKAHCRIKHTHLFGLESRESRCLEDTYDIDGKAIKAVPKKSIKPAKPDFPVSGECYHWQVWYSSKMNSDGRLLDVNYDRK